MDPPDLRLLGGGDSLSLFFPFNFSSVGNERPKQDTNFATVPFFSPHNHRPDQPLPYQAKHLDLTF